jgi:hypothetical protein
VIADDAVIHRHRKGNIMHRKLDEHHSYEHSAVTVDIRRGNSSQQKGDDAPLPVGVANSRRITWLSAGLTGPASGRIWTNVA